MKDTGFRRVTIQGHRTIVCSPFGSRLPPRLPASAMFISQETCFQLMPVSLEIAVIFLTRFATKTFHGFPGLAIQ